MELNATERHHTSVSCHHCLWKRENRENVVSEKVFSSNKQTTTKQKGVSDSRAKKKGNLELEKGKTARKRALHRCGNKHFRKCEIIQVGAFVDVKQMTRSEGFRRLCTGRVRMRQLEHEMKQEQRTDQN